MVGEPAGYAVTAGPAFAFDVAAAGLYAGGMSDRGASSDAAPGWTRDPASEPADDSGGRPACETAPESTRAALTVGTIFRRLGPAGPLAVVAVALPGLGGFALLGSITWIAPWLRSQGMAGVTEYAIGYALASGFAVLPTYAQSVVGGWAFGFALGFPAAMGGVFGAATIGYVIARRATGNRAMSLVDEHPKWRAVYDALLGSGFWKSLLVVTLLRLPPNSPFALTNLVMAAARVPYSVYVIGTMLGLAPRTAAVVFVGAGLSELDFRHPRWMVIFGIVTAVAVIVIIGAMANHAVTKVTMGDETRDGREEPRRRQTTIPPIGRRQPKRPPSQPTAPDATP